MGKPNSAGSGLLGRNLRVSLRRARVAEIVAEIPRVTERALCEAVGVGKGTIHRDKQALVDHAREASTAIQEQIRSRQTELLEEAVALALRGLVRELFDKEGNRSRPPLPPPPHQPEGRPHPRPRPIPRGLEDRPPPRPLPRPLLVETLIHSWLTMRTGTRYRERPFDSG